MTRILVPLDGSDFSAQVLPALQKLFAAPNCELVLYTVGSPKEGFTAIPPRPSTTEMPVPFYDSAKELERTQHPIYESQETDSAVADLTDQLEGFARPLRDAGYKVATVGELGNPAEAIIERARGEGIDLVAMTTHGRSGINRLLFGSVAEQVVRHVSIPVLLVHPVAQGEAGGGDK